MYIHVAFDIQKTSWTMFKWYWIRCKVGRTFTRTHTNRDWLHFEFTDFNDIKKRKKFNFISFYKQWLRQYRLNWNFWKQISNKVHEKKTKAENAIDSISSRNVVLDFKLQSKTLTTTTTRCSIHKSLVLLTTFLACQYKWYGSEKEKNFWGYTVCDSSHFRFFFSMSNQRKNNFDCGRIGGYIVMFALS